MALEDAASALCKRIGRLPGTKHGSGPDSEVFNFTPLNGRLAGSHLMTLSQTTLGAAFGRRAVEALTDFADTIGQCVALCAYISGCLAEDAIENRVSLGSLYSDGVTTFEYGGPFSLSASSVWDGHAWLEFPGGIIGEPSLFRTARARPPQSNLRHNLEARGLLQRGAILVSADAALRNYGLKYEHAAYLEEAAFGPLIGGLMAHNDLALQAKRGIEGNGR